ncbi:hypothetical protein ACFVKB_36895 [Rhodococcus sp. NPDC127530]
MGELTAVYIGLSVAVVAEAILRGQDIAPDLIIAHARRGPTSR